MAGSLPAQATARWTCARVTCSGDVHPSRPSASAISSRSSSSTPCDTRLAADCEAGGDRPADERRPCAEGQRLDHVGAAPEAAVDVDLAAPSAASTTSGSASSRGGHPVELAAAVVRDPDPVDAVLDREHRVLARHDPLQDERQLRRRPDPLEVAPRERRVDVDERSVRGAVSRGGIAKPSRRSRSRRPMSGRSTVSTTRRSRPLAPRRGGRASGRGRVGRRAGASAARRRRPASSACRNDVSVGTADERAGGGCRARGGPLRLGIEQPLQRERRDAERASRRPRRAASSRA